MQKELKTREEIALHYDCAICGPGHDAQLLLDSCKVSEEEKFKIGLCMECALSLKCAHCSSSILAVDDKFIVVEGEYDDLGQFEQIVLCKKCAKKKAALCPCCEDFFLVTDLDQEVCNCCLLSEMWG